MIIARTQDRKPVEGNFAVLEVPPATLFQPGSGTTPPELAGRDDALGRIQKDLINPVSKGEPPNNSFLLHGARGIGKTCLMEEAHSKIGPNIRSVTLTTAAMQSCAGVAMHIIKEGKTQAEGDMYLSSGGLAGLGSARRAQKAALHPETALDAMRACLHDMHKMNSAEGLIIFLDEVHALKKEGEKDALRDLLQAVQAAAGKSRRWPVGLIMAGTPDAYDHLLDLDATFVDRMVGTAQSGGNMPLGCLDAKGVQQALETPFRNIDRRIDQDVIKTAFNATHGYPHFVQLLGKAMCMTMIESNHRRSRITKEDAQPAWELLQTDKTKFYNRRLAELEKVGASEAALCVINAMLEKGGLSRQEVKSKCIKGIQCRNAADLPDMDDDRKGWVRGGNAAMVQIIHSGLIWGEEGAASDKFSFNIPSFASHTIQKALNSDFEHLRTLAAGDTIYGHDDGGGGGAKPP